MTFRTRMSGHIASTFLNTDHFAETVTYTPVDGVGSSITALKMVQPLIFTDAADGNYEAHHASFAVNATNVSSPSRGDTIIAGANTWYVDAWQELDGMLRLDCVRLEEREVGGEGIRTRRA